MTNVITPGDQPDALDPQEQLSHPDAEPATEDPTADEVQAGDEDFVEPYEGATAPTKAILL